MSYEDPAATRDAGFRHFVLSLPALYPTGAARRLADEVIRPLSLA